MPGVLDKLNIPTNVNEQIRAAKAAEMETEETGGKFPEFEIKQAETKTLSVLPGYGDWVRYAVSQLDDADESTVMPWIEERATAQLKHLDCSELVPSWATIPAGYPNAAKVSGLFVPKLGRISYARFPQAVLEKLPADHPRKLALTIRGKFGLSKIKHAVLLYCLEHPMGKKGLDDAALEQQIRQGGFVKLLALNMPSYNNLKDAKTAAIQMGKTELPSIHLVTTLQDPKFLKLGFQVNAMQEPSWHKPELLRLVLQEVEKLGPVATKNPYREVSDEEFAEGVKQALDSSASSDAPIN